MALAGAKRRDFPQNPHCQLLNGIESFGIVAPSVSGERGEPKSDLGCLFCELIHLGLPR
jgi:hypothetical protein